VSCRGWCLVIWALGALLSALQAPAFGQQNAITADQIIANYLLAIGGSERIESITTFAEKGELSGDLTNFGQPFVPTNTRKEKGTFQFYFKAPNLRSYLLESENDTVLAMRGCNGTVAWYVGADAIRREVKPKPGNEYECENGYDPVPLGKREPNLRFQLKGKKKVADRMAWAIRAYGPRSQSIDTYYFDADSYLLLRRETMAPSFLSSHGPTFRITCKYSDYRDVGGIKLAFMIVQEAESSSLITVLREVQINGPIADARFEEPTISISSPQRKSLGFLQNQSTNPEVQARNPPNAPPAAPEITSAIGFREMPVALSSPSSITTNFVSFSVAELQQVVPELRGLKPAKDQMALPTLLDRVGDRTVDLSRRIPNLISHEDIFESERGAKTRREQFSYLILARRDPEAITLEEFRVDLKTGASLETDDPRTTGAPVSSDSSPRWDKLAHASLQTNARASGGPPLCQGFASMWLRFYPSNRPESSFRYVGEQEIDGRPTFVLAFAQKPGSVRLPAEVRFKDKSVPVYYQGIAWVDISDFRIVRLRTDLLPNGADLPLTQLTAEVRFADTQATGFASRLWLPREVEVTSRVDGHTFNDKHSYSHYRSFKVNSKILLNP
jgi:hypothetical protein